jgi:hypothetical protein
VNFRTFVPEAAPLAGDLDLLVPVENHWSVLDLSLGAGSRAEVFLPRVASAQVLARAGEEAYARARAAVLAEEGLHLGVLSVLDAVSPHALVIFERAAGGSLEAAAELVAPGGWLIWLEAGERPVLENLKSPQALPENLKKLARWSATRLSAQREWKSTLARRGLVFSRAYLYAQEYAWGFLPLDVPETWKYYLEHLQEEGQGAARGRARLARALAEVGAYPYLVSNYVVVAQRPAAAGRPR